MKKLIMTFMLSALVLTTTAQSKDDYRWGLKKVVEEEWEGNKASALMDLDVNFPGADVMEFVLNYKVKIGMTPKMAKEIGELILNVWEDSDGFYSSLYDDAGIRKIRVKIYELDVYRGQINARIYRDGWVEESNNY